MEIKNIEKKTYELLGVNFFRKYILFTWDTLLTPIGGAPGYRIDKLTIKGIEEYKSTTKLFARAHFWMMMGTISLYFLNWVPESFLICNIIVHLQCIMTQRYTYLRINEILEKHKRLEKRKLKNVSDKENETKKQEQIPMDKDQCYWTTPLDTLEAKITEENENFQEQECIYHSVKSR